MATMQKNIVSLTDSAAAQIKAIIAQAVSEQEKPVIGLRISVKARGCSGKSYKLDYATEHVDGDEIIEEKGVKLFIDPAATLYIIGTEMDYREEELESGFVFSNPNEKGRCGCGESFHV